jgi:xanthine/uracil permease
LNTTLRRSTALYSLSPVFFGLAIVLLMFSGTMLVPLLTSLWLDDGADHLVRRSAAVDCRTLRPA